VTKGLRSCIRNHANVIAKTGLLLLLLLEPVRLWSNNHITYARLWSHNLNHSLCCLIINTKINGYQPKEVT
jgi:hypothetical protein